MCKRQSGSDVENACAVSLLGDLTKMSVGKTNYQKRLIKSNASNTVTIKYKTGKILSEEGRAKKDRL